jgi:hypothetical protein
MPKRRCSFVAKKQRFTFDKLKNSAVEGMLVMFVGCVVPGGPES